jgi:hypothetical protein
MTKEETTKILAVLKGIGVKFEGDTQVIIEIWADCFKEDNYLEVNKAVKKLMIQEKQLFQNGLIAKIKELLIPENLFLDSASAWNQVRQLMDNGYIRDKQKIKKSFSKLDLIIQKVIGSATILEEWEYDVEPEILNTVIKSNFIREYNNLCRIYKDDLKNGGKMLEYLQPLKLTDENKENIKKLESVTKELVKDDKSF